MQTELKHARPCVRILCRKCYSIVKLKVIEPLMFIDGICEAVYQCKKCGTIRKRRPSVQPQSLERCLTNQKSPDNLLSAISFGANSCSRTVKRLAKENPMGHRPA